MYMIKKNGKQTVRKLFDNYEQARSYLRRMLRMRGTPDPTGNHNPSYSGLGYTIQVSG